MILTARNVTNISQIFVWMRGVQDLWVIATSLKQLFQSCNLITFVNGNRELEV